MKGRQGKEAGEAGRSQSMLRTPNLILKVKGVRRSDMCLLWPGCCSWFTEVKTDSRD